MLSEQEINYRKSPKTFSWGGGGRRTPALLEMFWISYTNIKLLFLKLGWFTFALSHRVVARSCAKIRITKDGKSTTIHGIA